MKPLPPLPRRWWLAVPTLLAAGGVSWLLNRPAPAPEPVPPPARAAVASVPAAAPAAPAQESGGGEAAPAQEIQAVDIFAVQTWEPPPPPPVDTPPQPPPLPFKFIGRIAVPGKGMAFMLAEGERVLVVSVGDSIGRDYRVEKYDKGQLLFRYRPMNIRQALAVGEATS